MRKAFFGSAPRPRPDEVRPHSQEVRPDSQEVRQRAQGPRPIGDLIREIRPLSDAEFERIVAHHRERGTRFGDAAIALNLATKADVLWALSQQFRYPYVLAGERSFSRELVMAVEPFGPQAEVFRELRSQILLGPLGEPGSRRAIAVVSAASGDGKTYFAANMAVALSQLGARTLLIDADMRSPRQQQLFHIESRAGLSNILAGHCELDLADLRAAVATQADARPAHPSGALAQLQPAIGAQTNSRHTSEIIRPVSELPGLYVLPAGTQPPNPLELLQGPALALLLAKVTEAFDHVIVDTPAAERGADARVVAVRSGGALVMARRHATAVVPLQRLIDALSATPTVLLGVVMNER